MLPPGADAVLVRTGEIGVKSEQVRRKMEQRLQDTVHALLADRGIDGDLRRQRYRLLIETDDPDGAAAAASDAFGVVSVSPVTRVEPTVDGICDALAGAARRHYDGGTFAVRARRAGDSDAHDFDSRDLEREGGAAIWQGAEAAAQTPEVDLDEPDQEFFVECREEEAFVFLEKRAGPGGLPLGSQRPVVALISGGIDSPVAAWEMMKRGCPLVPVYVDLGEYGGVDHRARAVETVGLLADYAPNLDFQLRVAPAGEFVTEIADTVEEERMLVLRRFMFRVAECVAKDVGATGIVTGESIGQKSSQTSTNLATTATATDLPIHRPLLTVDKTTITERAADIGTFRESTIPAGCNRIAPSFPETRASTEAVDAAQPADFDERARAVADAVELVESVSQQATVDGDAA
jgi:thiamine biosynthesis protein ThiI